MRIFWFRLIISNVDHFSPQLLLLFSTFFYKDYIIFHVSRSSSSSRKVTLSFFLLRVFKLPWTESHCFILRKLRTFWESLTLWSCSNKAHKKVFYKSFPLWMQVLSSDVQHWDVMLSLCRGVSTDPNRLFGYSGLKNISVQLCSKWSRFLLLCATDTG